MRKAVVIATLITSVAALGSYFSPHLTLYQMKRAIESRDADAFSEYVDFPALRENFKGQMMAKMNQDMSSQEMKGNPFAGLGQALATAFVGPMIDAMVSPAGVIAMMNSGKVTPLPVAAKGRAVPVSDAAPNQTPNYSVSYKGWNRTVVRVNDQGKEQVGFGFVFKRDGLWSWKLSAVEMPANF
jgi:hypothetical protein